MMNSCNLSTDDIHKIILNPKFPVFLKDNAHIFFNSDIDTIVYSAGAKEALQIFLAQNLLNNNHVHILGNSFMGASVNENFITPHNKDIFTNSAHSNFDARGLFKSKKLAFVLGDNILDGKMIRASTNPYPDLQIVRIGFSYPKAPQKDQIACEMYKRNDFDVLALNNQDLASISNFIKEFLI